MRSRNFFPAFVALSILLLADSTQTKTQRMVNTGLTSTDMVIPHGPMNLNMTNTSFSRPGEELKRISLQPDYVTQYWKEIVGCITTVCRSTPLFQTIFSSFSKTGAAAAASIEEDLIARALASYGAQAKTVLNSFLRTLISNFTRPGGFTDPTTGKLIKTEAELVSKLVRSSNLWRGMRMGSASIVVVLGVSVAIVAGTTGYLVGKTYLKKLDMNVKAAEDAAFGNALVLMAKKLSEGKLKLLPGVTQQNAAQKIKENLEVGRKPFLNVFEPRPCPDINGNWVGDLYVKEVKGSSNIQEGSKRPATFTISVKDCLVTLKFNTSQISGEFSPGETLASTVGSTTTRAEKDEAVLRDDATGNLSRAVLVIYGLGSGSLQGKMTIEIEQRTAQGVTIVSGGMFSKKGDNIHLLLVAHL